MSAPFQISAQKFYPPTKWQPRKLWRPHPSYLDSFLPISQASNSDIISSIKYGYIVKNIPIHALNSTSFEIFM
jgi:hypothetical protein